MALLAWLKREGFGTYETLDDFAGELGRRSTSALGALGAVLSSKPEDLVEAARGNGHGICADVVGDLRVAKGARLAALRAVLAAGAGAQLSKIFLGSSDLSADPRLPEADRAYLVKGGLKSFLDTIPPQAVHLDVLRAGAAAETAVKWISRDLVTEVLAAYPTTHTPALTVRHAALGDALPPDLEQRWIELLGKQYRAAKNAPAAAKRLGIAPEWPPVAAESMMALLERAKAAPTPIVTKPSAPAPSPGATAPAPTPATPAPEGPAPAKAMPALRPRARATNEDTYRPDEVQVAPEALQSAPATTATDSHAANTPPRPSAAGLKAMRFGEQVELVATKGTRALERLIAAFDVRAEMVGRDRALNELSEAARRRGTLEVHPVMLDDLYAFTSDLKTPPAWRLAGRAVLEHLSPDRFAALPEVVIPREARYARPER